MIMPVINTIIVTFIIILTLFALKRLRNGARSAEPNYRTVFVLGLTFIPIGLIVDKDVFFLLGVVFLILGIANVEKWNQTFAGKDITGKVDTGKKVKKKKK